MKSRVVPLYWELLLESLNNIVRVTERLYIRQDWGYKGHLKVTIQCTRLASKTRQYRHVYRMIDSDGLMGASHRMSSPPC